MALLLVDEDNFSGGLIKNDRIIVDKNRPPVDHDEKEYIAQSQNVDFLVEVEEIGTKTSKWKIGHRKPTTRTFWESTPLVSTCLVSPQRAVQTTLRRSSPRSGQQEELNLYFIKTIKGKSSGPTNLFFGMQERRNLAFGIFDILLRSESTTLVMGNLGFSTNSIFTYAMEYQREKSIDLVNNLCVLTTHEQSLFCLHMKALRTDYEVLVSPSLASRFLFVDIRTTATRGPNDETDNKDNSSSLHSAGTKSKLKDNSSRSHAPDTKKELKDNNSDSHSADTHQTFTLITKHEKFLKLLSNVIDEESFAYIMLQPVVATKSTRSSVDATDTIQLEGPIDIKETAQMLQMSLEIARDARKSVGVEASNVTLSEKQREAAFEFVKNNIFVKKFMRKEPHRTKYLALLDNDNLFAGRERQELRQTVRGAFKAWLHGLMGNTALFMVVLKHGLFRSKDHQRFMIAYHQVKQEGERDKLPTDGMSPKEKERVRTAALTARRNYRKAINLEASLLSEAPTARAKCLSPSEEKLVLEYRTGRLKQLLIAANTAYGHGFGSTRMETSEAVLTRKCANELEDYQRSCSSDG